MNNTLRHIEYLISRNDCVIIPGFGAVLAKNVSACYDEDNHTIVPPKRIFTFNSDLCHDDGMLADSISRSECISRESAEEIVSNDVAQMRATLNDDHFLALGAIGEMSSDAVTGALLFRGFDDSRLHTDTLWLNKLSLKPIDGEMADTVNDHPARRHYQYSPFGRFIRAAASIAVLIAVGFVASTPVTVENAMLASLAPDMHKVASADMVPEADQEQVLTIALPKPCAEPVADVDAVPQPVASAYYVIVASLATYDEAQKFLSYHPGENLKVLDMGRHYSIYSSVHDDVMEAYRVSVKMSANYSGAWVYKK